MSQFLQVAVSRNNAQTFGNWTLHPIPATGDFKHPYVIRWRCGQAREFVVKTRFTEPRGMVILALAVQMER